MTNKIFTHKPLDITYKLEEVYQDGSRFYKTPAGIFPSVTTVVGWEKQKFFSEWRNKNPEESKRVTSRGTKFHKLLEDYLNNEEIDFDNMHSMQKSLFSLVKPEIDKIDNIVALEKPLFSSTLGLAGRVDCIAEFDGVLSVIDFKTSKKVKSHEDIEDYFWQTSAYALMYEELIGEPIHDLVIIMAVEDSSPIVFKQKTEDHITGLVNAISYYEKSGKH